MVAGSGIWAHWEILLLYFVISIDSHCYHVLIVFLMPISCCLYVANFNGM
jgi:hypothetical protein